MMDKKELKENIDRIAKENSESWSESDRSKTRIASAPLSL